ncbi:MAG: hypothetical protein JSV33_14895 [bacterium]|nr:MAG: hypothetical protein JSV33_14895 [bacterium]
MPQPIDYDEDRIKRLIQEKQANEIELAWDLLEVFNTNEPLVGPLRQLVSFAVDELEEMKRESHIGHQIVKAAWNKEVGGPKNKTLINYGNLIKIRNNVPALKAEECNDIIRYYGEVVEMAAEKYRAQKKAAKYVPPTGTLRKYDVLDTEKGTFRRGGDPVWKVGRQRDKKPPTAPVEHPYSAPYDFIYSQKGGIANITLRDTSTVLRIDRVFGLALAGDISGTTTDALFFINRYANLFRAQFNQYPLFAGALDDPIYQLLPLATLVAGGHHSLVESALSLTINRHLTGVNYKIGLYTSLLPDNTNHPTRGEIWNKLHLAETNMRNRLMLIYYKRPTRIGGCFLFAKKGIEKHQFEQLATANLHLLHTFMQCHLWPTEEYVRRLFEA